MTSSQSDQIAESAVAMMEALHLSVKETHFVHHLRGRLIETLRAAEPLAISAGINRPNLCISAALATLLDMSERCAAAMEAEEKR